MNIGKEVKEQDINFYHEMDPVEIKQEIDDFITHEIECCNNFELFEKSYEGENMDDIKQDIGKFMFDYNKDKIEELIKSSKNLLENEEQHIIKEIKFEKEIKKDQEEELKLQEEIGKEKRKKELLEYKENEQMKNIINILNEIEFKHNNNNKIDYTEEKIYKNYKGEKSSTKSFGVVVYMDKEEYENEEKNFLKNKNIHIPACNKLMGCVILKWFGETIGIDKIPLELIINHEHGDRTKKCHKQVFIKFNCKIYRKINPSYFDLLGKRYLIMAQKCIEEKKLKQYCKYKDPYQDEPYYEFNFSKKMNIEKYLNSPNIKDQSDNRKIGNFCSIYDNIINLENSDNEETFNLYKISSNKNEKEKFIIYLEKIKNFHQLIMNVKKSNELEFKWNYPQFSLNYLKEQEEEEKNTMIPDQKYLFYYQTYEWFKKYCINNKRNLISVKTRKKGLVIYGPRNIGKTYFFLSWVANIEENPEKSPFVIYCRGPISYKNFGE